MARTDTLDDPASDTADHAEAYAPPPLAELTTSNDEPDPLDDDTLTQYVDALQRQSFIRQLERRTLHSRDQDA